MNVAMLPCIKWQVTTAPSSCGIPCSCITAKGTIITGDAPNNPVSLPVGVDGQALVACAACATGLTWVVPAVPVSPATPTVAGTVLGCTLATNTALGGNALLVNTSAGNTAIGQNALTATTSGDNNTGVGWCALKSNTTGVNNTALGSLALSVTTTGNFNVGVGRDAMVANTTGCCNTAIGYRVACALTTGSFNVAIGTSVQVASPTGSCQLAIGFSETCNWLTGDSSKNIQPGAGIKDCSGSIGTVNQVLCSNGTHLQWANVGALPPGRVVSGIVNSGVAVCMDNIQVRFSTAGNRSFQFATLSGSATVGYMSCPSLYFSAPTSLATAGVFGNQTCTLTTSFIYFNPGNNYANHNSTQEATIIYGNPPTAAYNVMGIVGAGYLNNIICITRIV
jgi:hypothetical protein